MAIVSRLELDHPALGTAGGASLHASIESLYSKIGDSMSSRWFSIADFDQAQTVELDHNFGASLSTLQVDMLVFSGGEWIKVLNESTPGRSDFTLAEKAGDEKAVIEITNDTGGDNLVFAVSIVFSPIYLQDGDIQDLDISGATDGQLLAYNATSKKVEPSSSLPTGGDIQDFVYGEESLAAGATIAPTKVVVRLTSGTQVDMIDTSGSKVLILVNDTGGEVLLSHLVGATPAFQVITGTGEDLKIADQSSISLLYDATDSKWRVYGGSGAGGTFKDVPFVPSVDAENIVIGPSTVGGIDLIIGGEAVGKLTPTVLDAKPSAVGTYVATEFYSAIISYNPGTDLFDIQYSADSYIDAATARLNFNLPVIPLNYEVCRYVAQVATTSPGTAGQVLTMRDDDDLLRRVSFDGTEEYSSFSLSIPHSFSKHMAVNYAGNTFAISSTSGSSNKIQIYNLTTGALLQDVNSTTTMSNPRQKGIAFDSSVSRYVIFAIEDNFFTTLDYLITEHDPVTGIEVAGSTGTNINGWQEISEANDYIDYISSTNTFIGSRSNGSLYTISKANYQSTFLVNGASNGKALSDGPGLEVWSYALSGGSAKVFTVAAGPVLTFDRDVDASGVRYSSSYRNYTASLEFVGTTVDSLTSIDNTDTRAAINNQLTAGPLSAGVDTTLSTNAQYKDLFIDGDLTIDGEVVVNGDVIVKGDLTVNGKLVVSGDVTAYTILCQTADHFDLEILGSLILGHPTSTSSSVLNTKLFNIGGDLKKAYPANTTNFGLRPIVDGVSRRVQIGGNILIDEISLFSFDDGVGDGVPPMIFEVGGDITCTDTFANTSQGVNADRQIAEGFTLDLRGNVTVPNFLNGSGSNQFNGANAKTADTPQVTIHGNLTVSSLFKVNNANSNQNVDAETGQFSPFVVKGNIIARTFQLDAGSTDRITPPNIGSSFLDVDGSISIEFFNLYNGTRAEFGSTVLPKFPNIICRGRFTVSTTWTIGYNNPATISETATWKIGEFFVAEVILQDSLAYPPTCLNLTADKGLAKMSVGRFDDYPGQVLPGFVAGAVGTVDKVPSDIFVGSGEAVRRDVTGNGTSYVWLERTL
jgi:hypothetical protein